MCVLPAMQNKPKCNWATPQIVLLMIDLDLPGQDGFSLIREVRKHFPSIPVVAVSGALKPHVIESEKVIGAAETLQKPIDKDWTAAIARVRAKYGKPSTSF